MKRYIDAENAKSYIYGQFVDRFPPFTLGAIIEGMDDIETEDVAPVVHAHWIENEDCSVVTDIPWSMCAACGSYSPKLLYCAFCGAKMDEEVDDG